VQGLPALSQYAIKVLLQAAEHESEIMVIQSMRSGDVLQIHNYEEELGLGRRRAEALAALDELETHQLIRQVGFGQSLSRYDVLLDGYRVADQLAASACFSE